jgi:hypothetical protein
MQILPIAAAAGLARAAGPVLQNLLGLTGQPAVRPPQAKADTLSVSPQAVTAARAQSAQARAMAFADELRTALGAAGVRLDQPLVLKTDAEGRVTLDGAHPDHEQVANLLARDTGLAAQFSLLARDMAAVSGNPNGWTGFRMTIGAADWKGSFV